MKERDDHYLEKKLRKILADIACEIRGSIIQGNSLTIYFSNKYTPLNLDVVLAYLERCEKEIK